MIVITIAFVSCFNWLRSVMERYADAVTSAHCQFIVSGFVGLLTYPFMRRGFSPLRKRIASAFSRSHDSSSNDRFSPHAGCVLHGKQYFRNTATLGSLPRCLLTAEAASFRVRDSHPIPLFSEQECVSEGFSATWRSAPCLPYLSGSRICHKSHAIQFFYMRSWFMHANFPFQNLHPYLTAIRGDCKVVFF